MIESRFQFARFIALFALIEVAFMAAARWIIRKVMRKIT
jgi:hypothetical protein